MWLWFLVIENGAHFKLHFFLNISLSPPGIICSKFEKILQTQQRKESNMSRASFRRKLIIFLYLILSKCRYRHNLINRDEWSPILTTTKEIKNERTLQTNCGFRYRSSPRILIIVFCSDMSSLRPNSNTDTCSYYYLSLYLKAQFRYG